MAVARHRPSSPSRRIATARVRARPRTITTDSTTPSRGSHTVIEPIKNVGRLAITPLICRARDDSTTRLSRCLYTSSLTQREICSSSRAPARISITQRVRFSSSGSGSGSSARGLGWWPKNSSGRKRGRIGLEGSGPCALPDGASVVSTCVAVVLTVIPFCLGQRSEGGVKRAVYPCWGDDTKTETSCQVHPLKGSVDNAQFVLLGRTTVTRCGGTTSSTTSRASSSKS